MRGVVGTGLDEQAGSRYSGVDTVRYSAVDGKHVNDVKGGEGHRRKGRCDFLQTSMNWLRSHGGAE